MIRNLAGPIVVLILFGSAMLGRDRLAFRDVSHFYIPLYGYVAERTSEEWLPLWNPLDHTGISLLGETSTAVLYPIRYAVYCLPLESETAMAWYVALHLILASFTANWAARRAGGSPTGGAIAGVLYPLSGTVLFLYCNPPFLVGAAWLPLVVGALVAKKQMSVRVRCLIAGPALAMMVLGGDPQTALHAVLVAGVVALCRLVGKSSQGEFSPALRAIVGSAVLGVLLSAPQIAASMSWSSQSDRHLQADITPWYQPPASGSIRADAYGFSLPPWHSVELLTPSAFGSPFPKLQRISKLIPGDGRVWTPTIYMGLFSALALLSQLGRARDRRSRVWLAVAFTTLLLSMGHFGLAWVLQQAGLLRNYDSAIGGPYWWLHQFLPGYDSFRYPTKWLPVFSLAVSILAAQWFDRITSPSAVIPKKLFWCMAAVLTIGLSATFFLPALVPKTAATIKDSYWGPLDVDAGIREIQWSILSSIVLLGLLFGVLRFETVLRFNTIRVRQTGILLLLALELGVVGHGLILKVDSRFERARIVQPANDCERWLRTTSDGGWPLAWSNDKPSNTGYRRTLDVAAAERLSWFGRWHLEHRVNVFNSMTSIRSQEVSTFWRSANELTSSMDQAEREEFWRSVRQWLSINGVVNTSSKPAYQDRTGETILTDIPTVTQQIDGETSELTFHHEWSTSENQPDLNLMRELLLSVHDRAGNHQPVVDLAADARPGPMYDHATEARYVVDFSHETLVTRPVYQDGHWYAELSGDDSATPLEISKVDFLKQGVVVPPGRWTVRFYYAPFWVLPSIAVAVLTWLGLILLWISPRKKTYPTISAAN